MRTLLSLILVAGAIRSPVHQDASTRIAKADPAPRVRPSCVCQGIALSPEQVKRGVHICSNCRAP